MKSTHNMPRLNPEMYDSVTADYVRRISNKGALRASKPRDDGEAAYVWRMTAFLISPISQHQCMPVTADWDIKASYAERREITKRLDKVVDAIVDGVPKTQWHGVTRWGQAFGIVGTPMVAPDGSIIYR
jgi:hypothetical protein